MTLLPTVMKFGGTSVEDTQAFERVRRIVSARQEMHPVVVVSAMSRVTDALLASVHAAANGDTEKALLALDEHYARHETVARDLLPEEAANEFRQVLEKACHEIAELLQIVAARLMPLPLLQDVIVSYGERLSASLLAYILRDGGLPAQYVDARRCITTDERHGRATPLFAETARRTSIELEPLINASLIPVLGGFIAATADGATTTLGRNGSDYSAAIFGAVLAAREIQVWTDVAGVLTADPRLVKTARTVSRLSYAEAAELAYFGAKVLHPKTIQPAVERGIPVRICNSRAPDQLGTLICAATETLPLAVKAIAHKINVTTIQITSAPMLGADGFLRKLFEIFEQHRTIVDVVTTSEASVSLSLADTSALSLIVRELQQLGTVRVEDHLALICVVGEGLRATPGIAARIFNTISDINISLISQGASSLNLTFVVDEERVGEAVMRLHEEFFDEFQVSGQKSKAMASA